MKNLNIDLNGITRLIKKYIKHNAFLYGANNGLSKIVLIVFKNNSIHIR